MTHLKIFSSADTKDYVDRDHLEDNADLAMPMLHLRALIAERWQHISDLLTDLNVKQKPQLTQKILQANATSNHIRQEIERILRCAPQEDTALTDLTTQLKEIENYVSQIEKLRDTLHAENRRIVGAFFQEKKFAHYYERQLDFPTRKTLAAEGFLRACDTFDPSKGSLSTYAFRWMKSYIQAAAKKDEKHTNISLDREPQVVTSTGSSNLLGRIPDPRAKSPDVCAMQREMVKALHAALETMPLHLRRTLELTQGLGNDRNEYTAKEAAATMTKEGLRTSKNTSISLSTVYVWERLAMRWIKFSMTPSVRKNDEEE